MENVGQEPAQLSSGLASVVLIQGNAICPQSSNSPVNGNAKRNRRMEGREGGSTETREAAENGKKVTIVFDWLPH